jgi:hypothetical protein
LAICHLHIGEDRHDSASNLPVRESRISLHPNASL